MSGTDLERRVEKLAREWEDSVGGSEWEEQRLFMNYMAYCTRPTGNYTDDSLFSGAVSKENPERHIRAYKSSLVSEMSGLKPGSAEKKYYDAALRRIEYTFPELSKD